MQYLAQVLRGLSGGTDPLRLLSDAVAGAVAAAGGRNGIIVGVIDGAPSVITASGSSSKLVMETARAAMGEGRITRRRDPDAGSGAVAAPVRIGQRTVGAIAVGGDPMRLDAAPLPLFADAAGLALARRPAPLQYSVEEFSDALLHVGSDLEQALVLARLFEATQKLFGALGGFCVVPDGEAWRVAHYQGITAADLRAAAQHPDFRGFVASATLRVEPPTHPVVAGLVAGAETAVSVPLVAAGRRYGFLVLFLGDSPTPAAQAALCAFANQAAMILRSSEVAQRLRDHEQRLAGVVHSSPNPVILLDDRGHVVLVNGAAAELFHLPEAFAVGHPVTGRLGHEALERVVAEQGEGQLEVLLGTPPDRLYLATTRRMRAAGGRDLGRILVFEDVTKERETDKLKNDFVSVIGHELRTPLTVVKGYVKMLARKGSSIDESSLESVVTALTTNTVRLERLIEDLLFVSAIESRRPTLDLQPVDIGQVLDEFSDGRVMVKRPRRPIAVQLDRQKLDQILHHLLDNALKYTDAEVVITVVDGDEELEIQVDDSGPGIYSGDVPQLFERFRQLDGSSTRTHGGTGLGLYICRRLVELQGGRIWCESRLGVGSRFAFTLPKDGPVPAVLSAARPGQ